MLPPDAITHVPSSCLRISWSPARSAREQRSTVARIALVGAGRVGLTMRRCCLREPRRTQEPVSPHGARLIPLLPSRETSVNLSACHGGHPRPGAHCTIGATARLRPRSPCAALAHASGAHASWSSSGKLTRHAPGSTSSTRARPSSPSTPSMMRLSGSSIR